MGKNRIPASRTIKGLAPVIGFAKPHVKGLLLAFFLMAFQSATSAGRVVLLFPILTRVVPVEEVTGAATPAEEAEDGSGVEDGSEVEDEGSEARRRAELFTKGSGTLGDALDDLVDWSNALTKAFVPDDWKDDAVGSSMTAEEAAAARAREEDRYATLLSVLLLFLVATAVMCAATYGEGYVVEWVRLHILMDVRRALCTTLLDQPVAFYDQKRRGALVQRVLGDVEGYAAGLRLVFTGVAKGLFAILMTVTFMALVSWQLLLVCLLGLPFFLPMRTLMRRTLKRAHRRQQESEKRVEVLLQIFSGIRAVKAFGTEERRVREFRAADEAVTHRGLKVQRAKSTASALTEFINNFLALLLGVGGAFCILRGLLPVSPGQLVVFLLLSVQLYQPLKRLVKQYSSLQDSMASIERTTEWLELPPGSPDRPDAVTFPGVTTGVAFENVTFSYVEGQPVLHDVSFEIPRGGTVALVGPSGGGKSSLCDLLLRFYDPDQGRITVDGTDVRAFTRTSLLASAAVVTQEPFLFHTSIRENIRQGLVAATDQQIEDAARAAQIHDHIVEQPEGYESEVGEAGVRLSGGQRQRITIARALVRNPEILVLDEATASLDTASERAVQAALERLQEGRTTLMVAHRLSTVRHADCIVVLEHGSVVDRGTHAELLERGGLYADLVAMQDLGADSGA